MKVVPSSDLPKALQVQEVVLLNIVVNTSWEEEEWWDACCKLWELYEQHGVSFE